MGPLPLDVPQVYNKYALGWIREVSPQSSPCQHVLHMLVKSIKIPSCAGIVRIPRLRDLGMRGTELTDEREDPYAVCDHVKGTPLGHALLGVKEVDGPFHVAHRQSCPVAIAVEGELCATRTLKLYGSHHFHLILLIERVLCINEEEHPALLLCMLLPQEVHRGDYPFGAHLHPSAKLFHPTSLLCLLTHHLQSTLRHNSLLSFSHSHRPHSWAIFEANQADGHEPAVCGPWGLLVCQPLRKLRDNLSYIAARLLEMKQLILQGDQVGAPHSGAH